MNKIKGFKIRLRKREILKILKYDPDYTRISLKLADTLQEVIEKAYSLIMPSAVFNTYPAVSEEFSQIKKELPAGSKKVEGLLKKSVAISMMAVTIGKDLENEVDKIKEKDFTSAIILDAAGSEAVEQSANFISKILRESADKQENELSIRFSPGFGDWPIEISSNILTYLSGEKIEMTLSSSGILKPRKSITAIHAWIQGKRK